MLARALLRGGARCAQARRFTSLISAQDLAGALKAASQPDEVCVIDCGSREEFARAHVPGAALNPFEADFKDPRQALEVVAPDLFAEAAAALGLTARTRCAAVYGGSSLKAYRLAWALAYHGVPRVHLLAGPWSSWVDAGLPVEARERLQRPEAEQHPFVSAPQRALVATWADVLAASRAAQAGDGSAAQVIDVRTPGEYTGDVVRGTPRGGHVPGAVSIPHSAFLAPSSMQLKPAEELRAIFLQAGVDVNRPAIVMCHAGVRAAVGFAALKVAGGPSYRVANYDASAAEWLSRDDLPIVKGPERSA